MDMIVSGESATAAPVSRIERFEFSATGSEYFRIWIVNLALTLVTLGTYSAWAKVRRLRYFYGSTRLAGSSFEYHGDPRAILKGRLIAAAFLIPYFVVNQLYPIWSLWFLALFLVALPFIVVKSRRFHLRMSSWRNVRFDFTGSYGQAAKVYLGLMLLVPLTLGMIFPYNAYAQSRFLIRESRFGTTAFAFGARPGPYYVAYILGALAILAGGILAAAAAVLIAQTLQLPRNTGIAITTMAFMMGYLWAFAIINAGTGNAALGSTSLSTHRLHSDLSSSKLFGIYLSNTVLTVLTLGLFIPWAQVRLARYRLESLHLEAIGDLDTFVAGEASQTAAAGEELGDLLDLDFGL